MSRLIPGRDRPPRPRGTPPDIALWPRAGPVPTRRSRLPCHPRRPSRSADYLRPASHATPRPLVRALLPAGRHVAPAERLPAHVEAADLVQSGVFGLRRGHRPVRPRSLLTLRELRRRPASAARCSTSCAPRTGCPAPSACAPARPSTPGESSPCVCGGPRPSARSPTLLGLPPPSWAPPRRPGCSASSCCARAAAAPCSTPSPAPGPTRPPPCRSRRRGGSSGGGRAAR